MKAISLTLVFSFGLILGFSQVDSLAQASTHDKSSRAYYSLFWGLFKSKNFKPIKIEPIKIKNISLDSLDKDYEKKQVLWGALQWTEKKKKTRFER